MLKSLLNAVYLNWFGLDSGDWRLGRRLVECIIIRIIDFNF